MLIFYGVNSPVEILPMFGVEPAPSHCCKFSYSTFSVGAFEMSITTVLQICQSITLTTSSRSTFCTQLMQIIGNTKFQQSISKSNIQHICCTAEFITWLERTLLLYTLRS